MPQCKNWTDEYLNLIDDCEEQESKLNEWEGNFISSMKSQLENNKMPSQKQIETLEKIWDKVTRFE